MTTYTLTLDDREAAALLAWLDVTEPERCGGEPGDDRHDAEGFNADDSCIGYCPGDIAALDRIHDAIVATVAIPEDHPHAR